MFVTGTKQCTTCMNWYPLSSFLKSYKGLHGVRSTCTECRAMYDKARSSDPRIKEIKRKQDKVRAQQNKLKWIEYKGGVCAVCGNMPHPAAMDFHHIDPTVKEGTPQLFARTFNERAKEELDKCILLCSNCHRVLHFEEREEALCL